jgi:magnesium chelatase family protein
MEIVSFAQYGYEGEVVKIEADLRRGIPAIDIVGLPDGAIREARERMRAAIRNSGLEFPRERILINLSPASLKKEGSGFDLPIALAVLLAAGGTGNCSSENAGSGPKKIRIMVLGELELSGTVRGVRGILPAVSKGLQEGVRCFLVPEENEREASILRGALVIGVATLTEAFHRLLALGDERVHDPESPNEPENAGLQTQSARRQTDEADKADEPDWTDNDGSAGLEDVRGQPKLVRALEIAAAGGHNLIVYGPPGCGKTLALRRFPSILPNLERETAIEVTRIYSLAGMQRITAGSGESLARRPPFREPNQSASLEGMTGGGKNCRPGEVSLAHGGVLFLDEAAQFRSSVLQALRTPLETGTVTVSRAGRSDTFPARFQLLMTVNPCPCGNFGTGGRVCTCTPEMIERYWKRMTAPLLDRIDLRIGLDEPDAESLSSEAEVSVATLRDRIARARLAQRKRGSCLNAHIEPGRIGELCALDQPAERTFRRRMDKDGLSGRAGHGILKTARTIADLEGSKNIGEEHIDEAADFRQWNSLLPVFL